MKHSFIQNEQLTIPHLTRLDETLRYTDPNIGFNPNDKNLEYKYADEHYIANFRNNVGQFGARFLGAAVESIATIPLAINAAINKDFSKLYDNDISNGIHDWLETLNTAMPVYRSQYEENHPVLKYLNILISSSLIKISLLALIYCVSRDLELLS